MRISTPSLPSGARSLRHAVSSSSLRGTIGTVLLALYFPALFVVVIGLPIVLVWEFGIPFGQAMESALLLGALGYLLGFWIVFK